MRAGVFHRGSRRQLRERTRRGEAHSLGEGLCGGGGLCRRGRRLRRLCAVSFVGKGALKVDQAFLRA